MLDTEKVNASVGHGTDVLGLSQYHTVLAFRLYGLQQTQEKTISGRVSLLDIKATLLDLLGLDITHETGISQKNSIIGHSSQAISPNHLFLESDFSPPAIYTVHPEMRNVLLAGTNYFQVDPITTHVTVKNSMEKLIIRSKQYADLHGDWILALYPKNKHEKHNRIPILVNLKTGLWTADLKTPFAQQSPAKKMLSALREFYGDEISL
jgi:hypothetical protein